jgi:hypothetical protein
MATLNTTIYLGQLGTGAGSINSLSGFPHASQTEGKQRTILVPYTMTGLEATADKLNIFIVKEPGDRLNCAHSKVTGEALGSAVTYSIGDNTNSTRFSGTITGTAVHDVFLSSAPGTDCYTPTPFSLTSSVGYGAAPQSQLAVVLTFIGVTTPTAGKKLLFTLAFNAFTG